MKLNPDCVRDIMLTIEDFSFGEDGHINNLLKKPRLAKYTEDEIQYNCLKLYEANYIDAITTKYIRAPRMVIEVSDLTFQGHEFLNTIRADTNWGKVKDTAMAVGIFSLKGLSEIAGQVTTAAIKAALQLGQ